MAWTFATLPQRHILTIPLLVLIHIISGISMSGISLSSGNIGYKLAPRSEAAAYLGVVGVTNAIAAGVAPIIGGWGADFFTNRELSLTINYLKPGGAFAIQAFGLEGWDFFFFFAFVIGLIALQRLARVREEGEADKESATREVVAQAWYEIRHFSAIRDLLRSVQLPAIRRHNVRRVFDAWQSAPAGQQGRE